MAFSYEQAHSLLQNARAVVADTNIPEESLAFLAENIAAALFCDPVSVAKAEKLRPILSRIHTLKPNRLEAELLSGVAVKTPEDAEKAAKKLLELGVKRVFLSLGKDGVLAAEEGTCLRLNNLPGTPVNTTGCGDAFMAALVWAYLRDLDLANSALAGLAAGAVTAESPETINPSLNAESLLARMEAR